MRNRSEEQIVKEIRETHKQLASLHEELFGKLSLEDTPSQDTKPKVTATKN